MNKLFKLNFIALTLVLLYCANPIERKKKQMENCKITLDSIKIQKYQILLIPPVPKIYFKAKLKIENQNSEEVTIQKFDFKLLTNEKNEENITLANAVSVEEHVLEAKSNKIIELDMVTTLEDNKESKVYGFVGDILGALLTNKEMEFLLKGNVHFETFLGKITVPFEEKIKTKVKP
ncbi:MAG: LEA type 2 family protein [Leptospiraceae bacterium]|nr:LEA type 2 family protein [Leptospiraceae bacterium]